MTDNDRQEWADHLRDTYGIPQPECLDDDEQDDDA